MEGTVSSELEVNVSASRTWKSYGSLQLGQIALDAYPETYSAFRVLKGDGHAGTVIRANYQPGIVPTFHTEEFLVVDDVKREKLTRMLEGGIIEQGVKSFLTHLGAVEKEGKPDACIMTASFKYVIEDESLLPVINNGVDRHYSLMKAVADYVTKHHTNTNTSTNSNTNTK